MDEKKVREAIERMCKMRDASDRGRKGCKNGGTKEMPVLWWRSDTI